MRSALLLTTAAALMIGVGFGAQAGASFTTITDPNDTDGSTIASGINDSGQIVGSYLGNNPSYSPSNPSGPPQFTSFGFSLTGSSYTDVVVPSSASTVATGVNNAGLITGYYVDNTSNAGTHGFTGTTGGGYTPFDNPNAISGNTWGSASNGTTTVGYFNDINGQHGFAGSSPFATATTLDYPSAAYTQAFGINNSGTVVGEYGDASGNIYGFAESGGNYTQISDPNGLYDTYATTVATGIDARGDIVGYYTDGGGATHGFIDVVGVGFITIDAPNSTQTEVLGVNDNDQIVGMYVSSLDTQTYGFVAYDSDLPEPATFAIFTLAAMGTGALRRRRLRQQLVQPNR